MKEATAAFVVFGLILGFAIGVASGASLCNSIWIQDALNKRVGAYNGTTAQFELFYSTNLNK